VIGPIEGPERRGYVISTFGEHAAALLFMRPMP
jgi:hypothetical protein